MPVWHHDRPAAVTRRRAAADAHAMAADVGHCCFFDFDCTASTRDADVAAAAGMSERQRERLLSIQALTRRPEESRHRHSRHRCRCQTCGTGRGPAAASFPLLRRWRPSCLVLRPVPTDHDWRQWTSDICAENGRCRRGIHTYVCFTSMQRGIPPSSRAMSSTTRVEAAA